MRRAIAASHTPGVLVSRLLRRLLLLSLPKGPRNEPGLSVLEYIEIYIRSSGEGLGRDTTRHADLLRGLGEACGIPSRDHTLYTGSEMRTIGARIVASIDDLGPGGEASDADKAMAARRGGDFPWWPDGWAVAAEEMREEESEK